MPKKKDNRKKRRLIIILLLLLLLFLFASTFLSPVFFVAIFGRFLDLDSGDTRFGINNSSYIISEEDTVNHKKYMADNVSMVWDFNVQTVGEQVSKNSGWKGEWQLTFTQKGQFTATYSIPGVYIPPTNQAIDTTQKENISLADLSEGGSYTQDHFQVTLVKDYGSKGALIQIDYDMTPEQENQVNRLDNLYEGTKFHDWGTIATTIPSIQLLIRTTDSVSPTPQLIR